MGLEFKKVDEKNVEVTKTDEIVTKNTLHVDFLKQQLVEIQAQQDRDNALREAEKLEVLAILAGAENVGVDTK